MLETVRRVTGEAWAGGVESVQKVALHRGKLARVFSFKSGRELTAIERVLFHTVPKFILPGYLKPIAYWVKPAVSLMGGRSGLAVGAAALSAWLLVELLPEGAQTPEDLKSRPMTDDDLRRWAMIFRDDLSPWSAYLLVRNLFGGHRSRAIPLSSHLGSIFSGGPQVNGTHNGDAALPLDLPENRTGLFIAPRAFLRRIREQIIRLKLETYSGTVRQFNPPEFSSIADSIEDDDALRTAVIEDLRVADFPDTATFASNSSPVIVDDFQIYLLLTMEVAAASLFNMLGKLEDPQVSEKRKKIYQPLAGTQFRRDHVNGLLASTNTAYLHYREDADKSWKIMIQGLRAYFDHHFSLDETTAHGAANKQTYYVLGSFLINAYDRVYDRSLIADYRLALEFDPTSPTVDPEDAPRMYAMTEAMDIAERQLRLDPLAEYLALRVLSLPMHDGGKHLAGHVKAFQESHPRARMRAILLPWEWKEDGGLKDWLASLHADPLLSRLLGERQIDPEKLPVEYRILLTAGVAVGDLSKEEWEKLIASLPQ